MDPFTFIYEGKSEDSQGGQSSPWTEFLLLDLALDGGVRQLVTPGMNTANVQA